MCQWFVEMASFQWGSSILAFIIKDQLWSKQRARQRKDRLWKTFYHNELQMSLWRCEIKAQITLLPVEKECPVIVYCSLKTWVWSWSSRQPWLVNIWCLIINLQKKSISKIFTQLHNFHFTYDIAIRSINVQYQLIPLHLIYLDLDYPSSFSYTSSTVLLPRSFPDLSYQLISMSKLKNPILVFSKCWWWKYFMYAIDVSSCT